MKYPFIGLVLIFADSTQAATPSVNVRHGNIICTRSNGTRLKLTTSGNDAEPVLAPDGHTVAFTRVLKTSALRMGICALGFMVG